MQRLPTPPVRFVRAKWKCPKCCQVIDPLYVELKARRGSWPLLCTRCGKRGVLSAGFGRAVCVECGLESMPCGWRGVDPPTGPELGCERCARRRPVVVEPEPVAVPVSVELAPKVAAVKRAAVAMSSQAVLAVLGDAAAVRAASAEYAKKRRK